LDLDAAALFNPQTTCHEVAPRVAWLFRQLNMHSVGWRALWPLRSKGRELLRRKSFDIIYITTGNFPLFCLGPSWAKEFDVPYVLDYHDPWIRNGIQYSTTEHTLKLKINRSFSKWMESYAVTHAAGVV